MNSALFGLRVQVSADHPRYVLPPEVIPGVPWPPGFRDEINSWSKSYLGTWNLLSKGQVIVIGGHTWLVRPEDYERLVAATERPTRAPDENVSYLDWRTGERL